MSRREEILKKVQSVPAIPAAAVKALQLLQNPDVKTEELTRVLEVDSGLTAGILKLSNSSFFGATRTIASVREAIVRLGIVNLRKAVMAGAVQPLQSSEVKGYDLAPGELWEHSVAVALGMEKLAKAVGVKLPGHAFSSAILIDVGKVVLGTFVDVDAAPIMRLAFDQRVPFNEAERQVLGIDHAEVGAELLKSWKLPDEIVQVVRWHHEPDQHPGDRLVVDLVHLADALTVITGISGGADGLNYRASQSASARFALPRQQRERIVLDLIEELQTVRAQMQQAA